MSRIFLAVLALVFTFGAAHAADPAALKAGLAATYAGDFHWKNDPTDQKVTIHFTSVVDGAVGKLWAFGGGAYDVDGRHTDIRVKCLIDPKTLGLQMWEINPQADNGAFTTDGSHVGSFSPDLKTITAVWTTKGSGQQGDLVLNAR